MKEEGAGLRSEDLWEDRNHQQSSAMLHICVYYICTTHLEMSSTATQCSSIVSCATSTAVPLPVPYPGVQDEQVSRAEGRRRKSERAGGKGKRERRMKRRWAPEGHEGEGKEEEGESWLTDREKPSQFREPGAKIWPETTWTVHMDILICLPTSEHSELFIHIWTLGTVQHLNILNCSLTSQLFIHIWTLWTVHHIWTWFWTVHRHLNHGNCSNSEHSVLFIHIWVFWTVH